MDRYPKTDLEFEALFESVYKRKVDASQLHELQKRAIVDQIRSKRYGKSIQNKGFDNSLAKPRIKTKLYLGKTAGGKKVYFNVEFSKQGIKCTSTIDLMEVARQIETFEFDKSGGRAKSFAGQLPTRRMGESNLTKITIAWLLTFKHICTYKKVGHVGSVPSRELTRELMYLVMPEVEGRNEGSKFFGVTWHSVITAWDLPPAEDFHRYKSYFNSLVKTELKEIDEVAAKELERKEKAS